MKTVIRMAWPLIAAALATGALAQGTGTKSLGTAKGGRVLDKEELRACLNQQKELAARGPGIDAERSALDRERDELQKIDAALKAEEEKLKKLAQSAEDVGKRTKELQQRIADYNDKSARFQASPPSGPTGDRQRRALDNEKAAIDRDTAQLEADRKAVGPDAEQAVKAYQARADTRNRAVDDWNVRNQALGKKTQAYETDRESWKIDCDGKSYREDDEKAIQAGK